MANWTRELIVAAAKETAAKAGGPLSVTEFLARSGITNYRIYRLFPEGGWTAVRRLAGLGRCSRYPAPVPDDQLLQEFHRVASELGAIPTLRHFARLTTMGRRDTLRKRLGRRPILLQRYREWLERNHPESPLLSSLLEIEAKLKPPRPASSPKIVSGMPRWCKRTGIVFGAPTNVPGLRHAPTNEQGVIYLFGILSARLGIAVEGIQSAYPDCEAIRCVDRKLNRWQPVRIEFEFSSSNFRDHGHDPAGCDMIVCWLHDWPDCPLEVIELRAVVEHIMTNVETRMARE
jgi:hypothetical protein